MRRTTTFVRNRTGARLEFPTADYNVDIEMIARRVVAIPDRQLVPDRDVVLIGCRQPDSIAQLSSPTRNRIQVSTVAGWIAGAPDMA
ncbi:hypothetical protein, partial [Rhizobium lusitanum]|uniref:hypothetical protein n=1 Tax=Rhizobium lusitanum TaxID=293958 RepID=UPI001959EAD2